MLSNLQAHKLGCHISKDPERAYEPPGSETKDFMNQVAETSSWVSMLPFKSQEARGSGPGGCCTQ